MVWDQKTDRIFQSSPISIAVEGDFYKVREFVSLGHDPYLLEKQLAGIDSEMSAITDQWIDRLRHTEPLKKIAVPAVNREIVSRFIALQYLRTADTKDILGAMYQNEFPQEPFNDEEKTKLHIDALWNLGTVNRIAKHIEKAVWVFARNSTKTPFVISDNPVAFRTNDNRKWMRLGFLSGTYAVYPLSPDIIMYCFDPNDPKGLRKLDLCLSPVILTDEMIESENSGQVFMAHRFLISSVRDFQSAREFVATIGTDIYAQDANFD